MKFFKQEKKEETEEDRFKKEAEKVEKEIDKLEADIRDESAYFQKVANLEQKKHDILWSIRGVWNKFTLQKWEKAEDFVKKIIPDLTRKQLTLIERDLKLIEDEKIVLKLIKKDVSTNPGSASGIFMTLFPDKAKQVFLTISEKEEELENEMIQMFKPVIDFLKELKNNFEYQIQQSKEKDAWSLIIKDTEYLEYMEKENKKIQDFFKKTYFLLIDSISSKIISFKSGLKFSPEDTRAVNELFERVKAKAGYLLYGPLSGYRIITEHNVYEKTSLYDKISGDLSSRIWALSLIALTKLNGIQDLGQEYLDCHEAIFYQIRNVPTKEGLEKGDDERPTIYTIYYFLDVRESGRLEVLSTTLVLGAEDATKLLIYFKSNPSKVYNFFCLMHDHFVSLPQPYYTAMHKQKYTDWSNKNRNGRVLFVDKNLDEFAEWTGKEYRLFNIEKEFLKKSVLTYQK